MWPNPQYSADLATFNKEILIGKLNVFWNVYLEVVIQATVYVIM